MPLDLKKVKVIILFAGLFFARRIGFCRSPDTLFPNNSRCDGEREPR